MAMDDIFVRKLEVLRAVLAFALPVTSGYRCPDYNDEVSRTGRDGPHTTGHAVDIALYGERVHRLLEATPRMGFSGIGLRQHGERGERCVHLDDLSAGDGRPRPWVWSYR